MKTVSEYEDRRTIYRLDTHERPKQMYEYWVTGRGEFPWDMLRHDSCWPCTGADASKLQCYPGEGYTKHRSIKLRSYREPTIERWSSFLWSVAGDRGVGERYDLNINIS